MQLGAGGLLMPLSPSHAQDTSRIAIVDWALLETALALGIVPIAAVELVLFRKIAVEPTVPESVLDLGLRGSVNFERLAMLKPSLIYGSNYSAWANETLTKIAPVRELSIFIRGELPYPKAEAAMQGMAEDHGLEDVGARYVTETAAFLASEGESLRVRHARPLLIINLGDARHFRAFGADSMFGDVATRMGFVNSWGTNTAYSATAPVGLEELVHHPDATIIIVGPLAPDTESALKRSALWRSMPAVREGRAVWLPPVNPFGGLPAARRFARLLGEGLSALP